MKASRSFLPPAIIATATAAFFFWVMLPYGAWAQSDTVDYVQTARHLLTHRGLTVYQSNGTLVPLSHFPPGYPLMLAAGMALGLNWVGAVRIVNTLAAGLLAFLLAWGLATALRRPLASLLALPVIALLPVARLLVGAMSEPPYFVLQAAWATALWMALKAEDRGTRLLWFTAAGVAVGLGTLTRYAGLHAWLTLALLLLLPRREWLRAATTAYAPPLLAFGAWKLWLAANHAPPIGRLVLNPAKWLAAAPPFLFKTARAFISPWGEIPSSWLVALFWLAVLALAALATYALLRSNRKTAWFFGGVWLAEGLASFPFMLASYALFLPTPALDWRIYAPAALALATGLLLWGGAAIEALVRGKVERDNLTLRRWQELCRGRGYYILAALVGLGLLAAPTPQHTTLASVHNTGLGYTSREWYTLRRELLPHVKALSGKVPLVSNDRGGLIIWCDCSAYPFTSLHEHTTPPAAMGTLANDPAHRLVRRGAAFVLIWVDPARQDLAWWGNPTRIAHRLIKNLHPCYQTEFGGIYFYSPPPSGECR